jgi:hypothetical protein
MPNRHGEHPVNRGLSGAFVCPRGGERGEVTLTHGSVSLKARAGRGARSINERDAWAAEERRSLHPGAGISSQPSIRMRLKGEGLFAVRIPLEARSLCPWAQKQAPACSPCPRRNRVGAQGPDRTRSWLTSERGQHSCRRRHPKSSSPDSRLHPT